jgi:hypothetical protein
MTTASLLSNSMPPQKADESPPAALNFAFPFKKSDGKDFIDEHQFHALLARESGGFFPVSDSGMWHGGIHVTEAGAGTSLDLKNGVRCLADGEVVAYRLDRAYPVSELPALAGKPAVKATYSTGFALVRHTTEFPRGTKLTFFSLYMHLKRFEEYQKDTTPKTPSYWSKVWTVTPFAKDIPKADVHRGKAAAGQIGLNIRSAPMGAGATNASVIGILRQGARVQIGAQQGSWGQIASIESGGPVIAASVGSFADPKANTGWIFLGKVHGHPLMEPVLSESHFDRIVVLPKPVKINAGDLIGHLGQYDHLSEPGVGNRMVHIEVFCDEKIKPYIERSRAWVEQNTGTVVPTILRIDRRVKLYAAMGREGANAPETGVIQIYPLSALAQGPKEDQFEETTAGTDGSKFHWWKVDSADVRHAPISGWVREQNHAGGRVTREAASTWVDFEVHEEAHDPMHTMFASPKAYLDYWLDADEPDVPALAKLSPLAGKVYRSVFTTGSGAHAADELRKASRDPWRQLRLSRLIVKHESEWANPGKWKQLYEWIEQRAGHDPTHEEEQKRIAKLVWWDAVTGKIEGFPDSADVFHIHPVGLVGNFRAAVEICDCGCAYIDQFEVTRMGTQYGPVYWGTKTLEKSPVLADLAEAGEISQSERRIIVAMSANEGKLDSVQSYDSEVLTAGAMQKTINPIGSGEFPTQVASFRLENENAYKELFEKCGWTVEGSGQSARMYYSHPELTKGKPITGQNLKSLIRENCSFENFRKKSKNVPLSSIVNAITNKAFERKQIMDFVTRLRKSILPINPTGYLYPIGAYFKSDLGRASALDHHVNRPAYVSRDIGRALDGFFEGNQDIPKNPENWGVNRGAYELQIVDSYGRNREMAKPGGIPVAPVRYAALKSRLN